MWVALAPGVALPQDVSAPAASDEAVSPGLARPALIRELQQASGSWQATDTEPQLDEPLYAAPTRVDRAGRIVAPVRINNEGPFRLVVDTGASASALSSRLAERLGLPVIADGVRLSGVTGTAVMPVAAIELLEAGDLRLRNLRLPVLANVFEDVDGILGMQGLEDKRITVDFINDQISIRRSTGERAARGFFTVPGRLRGRLLVINAKVGSIRTRAVIDTGADRTLGNEALRLALNRARRGRYARETEIFGATGDVQSGSIQPIPPVTLGSAQMRYAQLVFGDFHVFRVWGMDRQPAMLVGMDVLGSVDTLVIDYRRKEMQLRLRR
jgi:predicted aspartyl protease